MDTLHVQLVDTVQVVNNYMQSGDMDVSTLMMVIIAGAAVFISLWQIYATRRHNRLSVTPKIDIDLSTVKSRIGISIKNTGIGPAIIERFSFCVNGKEMYPFLKKSDFKKVMTELDLDVSYYFVFRIRFEGEYIEPGHSYFIIEFPDSETASNNVLEKVSQALKSVKIVINFQSIYGEKFPPAKLN